MREFPLILLSKDAFATHTAEALVNSNISVINYLRNSEVGDDELHPDAFASYCVDYYYQTLLKEGFAFFVHKTQWDTDLVDIVQAGLTAMNAKEHIAYFEKQMRRMKLFSKIKWNKFLQMPFEAKQEISQLIEDSSFQTITENLLTLNAEWLKQHPDTQIVSIEEMEEIIKAFLADQAI